MIAKYDAWICGQPELMAALHQLRGGDLACWCAPEAYDGEKLLELASWAAASNGRMAICAIVARRSSARWPTGWPALAHSGYCTTSPAGRRYLCIDVYERPERPHHLWLVGDEQPGSR